MKCPVPQGASGSARWFLLGAIITFAAACAMAAFDRHEQTMKVCFDDTGCKVMKVEVLGRL